MLVGMKIRPASNGREAERLDVDRQVDEDAVQRAVDEERLQVRGGEVAAPEQLEREHRLLRPPLDDDEREQRDGPDEERPPDLLEAAVGALHEPVRERAEAERDEHRAGEVEPPRPELRALLLAPAEVRGDHGEPRERQVDEEDPAPRHPFHERPADRRAGDRGDARERGPEPDRAPGLVAVRGAQERERVRGQERARDPLQRAGEQQHLLVRRCPGEERREREGPGTGDERPPPAVLVADRPAREVERGERERVGEEHPLLPGEAEAEVLLDRRQRHDHDRRVDERQRGADDRRRQRQPAALVERERHRPRIRRRSGRRGRR